MKFHQLILTKICAGILLGSAVLGMVGCGEKEEENIVAETTEPMAKEYQADQVTYRTVTSGEDWGPAITQVILDFKTELDTSSIKPDSFMVSSVRTYGEIDEETWEMGEPVPHAEERKVIKAYISDAEGIPVQSGSYVTLEMEIAPDLEAGSPFLFNMLTYRNEYVDTDYEISLTKPLMTKEGLSVIMESPDAEDYVGNISLLADDFDTEGKYTYTYDEGKRRIDLSYASWFPKENEKEGNTPLIIWLHGAGEGGMDPNVAILGNKVVNLSTEDIQQYFGETGAVVLAPQSPTMWLDTSGEMTGAASLQNNTGESFYTEALMSLITDFVSDHPGIDKTRIYLGGCSNGGYMTLNLLVKYPGAFAAAFPVCEPYANEWLTEEKLALLADVPMWLTAAKTDTIVTFDEYSNALYDQLKAAGSEEVYYSLFDDVRDTSGKYTGKDGSSFEYDGHWSWIPVLNNECKESIDGKEVTIFEWLAGQQGEGKMPELPLEKKVVPPVYFYITRHGETEYNVQGLVQGWCDSPLTEAGIAQAKTLSGRLADTNFTAVYTSDSKRAVDTCNVIMKGRNVNITVTEGLREIHFGELEATDGSILWDDPYHAWTGYDDVGGETYEETGNRVKRVLDLAASEVKEGGNVLISTHGLSIISLLDMVCPEDPLYQALEAGIDNCSITILKWDNGVYSLQSLNSKE